MAEKAIPARELVKSEWSLQTTVNADGTKGLTADRITAAFIQALRQEQQQTNSLLSEIRNLLLELGNDGLHEVIQHHRRVVRRTQVRERTRRRLARKAKAARGAGQKR